MIVIVVVIVIGIVIVIASVTGCGSSAQAASEHLRELLPGGAGGGGAGSGDGGGGGAGGGAGGGGEGLSCRAVDFIAADATRTLAVVDGHIVVWGEGPPGAAGNPAHTGSNSEDSGSGSQARGAAEEDEVWKGCGVPGKGCGVPAPLRVPHPHPRNRLSAIGSGPCSSHLLFIYHPSRIRCGLVSLSPARARSLSLSFSAV